MAIISSFRKGTPKVIRGKFSRLELNGENIFKDITAEKLARIRAAAKYAAKVMRKNVSKKGVSDPGGYPGKRSGGLRKSIGYRMDYADGSAFVGSKSPVVHLLEFGHGDGKTRNKRPFVFASLKQAGPELKKILSEKMF